MLTCKHQGVGSGERKKRTLPLTGHRAGDNIDLWGPGGDVHMVVRGVGRVCVFFALDGKTFRLPAHLAFGCHIFAPLGKHACAQMSAGATCAQHVCAVIVVRLAKPMGHMCSMHSFRSVCTLSGSD